MTLSAPIRRDRLEETVIPFPSTRPAPALSRGECRGRLRPLAPRAIMQPVGTLWVRVPEGQQAGGSVGMNLKPLGDRIIVEVLEEESKTASGIVLPETAVEKPQRAKVLAVGPGHYEDGQLVPLEIVVGDEVVFSKYGGTEVKFGVSEYLILRESDVLAKVVTSPAKAKSKAKA